MCAVSARTDTEKGRLSYQQLEARLGREIKARQAAEQLLQEKSRSLYLSNTALEKVARHLDDQRQQLDIILDNTVGGIFLSSEQHNILRANTAALTMFQLDHETILERTIYDLFKTPKVVDKFVKKATTSQDRSAGLETLAVRLDGTEFPVEVAVKNVVHNEKSSQHVWIIRDITQRRREEAERGEIEKEMAQAQKLEALGTLASGIAHEINTPVQYVGDNLRFLQDSFADLVDLVALYASKISDAELEAKRDEVDLEFLIEEAPASIEQSLYGLEQVARIVKAIKEFSHPGAKDAEKADLNRVLSTAATLCKNQWKYIADVDFELDENLPKVTCYVGDISQVIVNMIVNAADAIRDKGDQERGKITLSTHYDALNVYIDIADTGCGMSEEVQKRIFDPFFTTKDVGKGTGQGLAISYNIVRQKHGGEIKCKSKPGEGTLFTISIPSE